MRGNIMPVNVLEAGEQEILKLGHLKWSNKERGPQFDQIRELGKEHCAGSMSKWIFDLKVAKIRAFEGGASGRR